MHIYPVHAHPARAHPAIELHACCHLLDCMHDAHHIPTICTTLHMCTAACMCTTHHMCTTCHICAPLRESIRVCMCAKAAHRHTFQPRAPHLWGANKPRERSITSRSSRLTRVRLGRIGRFGSTTRVVNDSHRHSESVRERACVCLTSCSACVECTVSCPFLCV